MTSRQVRSVVRAAAEEGFSSVGVRLKPPASARHLETPDDDFLPSTPHERFTADTCARSWQMESNGRMADDPPHRHAAPSPEESHRAAKRAKILETCRWKDVDQLRALSVSDAGLISDELRRQAWPVLLGCADGSWPTAGEDEKAASWQSLPRHRDEDQVRLDVDRSFIYYPNDQSVAELDRRKGELSSLITEVLRRQPYLCYFQGYHDICQVLLLVLDPPQRAQAVARLSALRIRDYMLPTLAPALSQLRLIPALIHAVNPRLWRHLAQTQPFFALSGTLTMYAHDIQEYGDIARLFDALLAREAVFSVYMFARIVLRRADELFDTPDDEPEMLHSILSKLPKPLDLESLISTTVELFDAHPPESLPAWSSISSNSVLKTARLPNAAARQSLADGEIFFQRQVQELQWAERREKLLAALWKYRKPVSTVGLAVLVGVFSYYMRRSPSTAAWFSAIWRGSKKGI
ncbi:MAG: hypothetical protein M1818_006217 [Claussenomyces sp. TS43310]|nr:MAG: hypothetical protein M1818_006217 [Claussenomyces sp. TS43310]